ncbi:MAG TPA: hypothetical protein PKK00_12030 [Bacteroidales bacterium]|nr:hypothetical protein [Bacteroidales bacterium]HPS17526.1 hypothetical protein [Bacteroidales bacterium]
MKKFFTLTIIIFSLFNLTIKGQEADTSNTKYKDMGVAVSPASMHLSIKPGTTVTKEITINNDSKTVKKFNIGFTDFIADENAKPVTASKDSKYAMSKYINIVPSYVELQPYEKTKIKLIITIPDTADFSAWTIVTIDQTADRPKLDPVKNDKSISMGIVPSIGFGVYVYQNPPNVKTNNVEILNFYIDKDKTDPTKKNFIMKIKNTGDGIGYSTTYVELVNLSDGTKTRLPSRNFTVLPQFSRYITFKFPTDLKAGKYSALGVIDFGSEDIINGQELEFTYP